MIDIGAPDYETRLAILSRRVAERQVSFSPEVLAAVAELPIGTVRELLGALNRLIAQQAVVAGRSASTRRGRCWRRSGMAGRPGVATGG